MTSMSLALEASGPDAESCKEMAEQCRQHLVDLWYKVNGLLSRMTSCDPHEENHPDVVQLRNLSDFLERKINEFDEQIPELFHFVRSGQEVKERLAAELKVMDETLIELKTQVYMADGSHNDDS